MVSHPFESFVKKRLYPLVRLIDTFSWVMLFVLMTMTALDLFLRNFTNTSILGSVELTELMMVIIVFCALAQCEISDGHIRVELVMDKFGPKTKAVADIITQSICTAVFMLMSVSIFHHALNMRTYGEVTMDWGIPLYPFVFIAFFGCAVLALVLLCKTIIHIFEAVQS